MSKSLADLLKSNGFELTSEEEREEQERLASKHRGKSVLERPKTEVKLVSLAREDFEPKKTQKDPTADLVLLPRCYEPNTAFSVGGYLIWCEATEEMWYAPTKLCLDANFIYRDDLEIIEITTFDIADEYYKEKTEDLMPGVFTRKYCYLLDNPSNETYEAYWESNYPLLKYGKSTPNGMSVQRYDNRFHRDMAILELDNIYSTSSQHAAKKMSQREFKANEAIVISDGCWMRDTCAASFVYLDDKSIIKQTEGVLPTEPDQAVLISEIKAATNALRMCKEKQKKRITYYYDNTSILNVFRNRKTEYIEEIVEYKKLLEDMHENGYAIQFVELHPKTGENRDTENKALMFFHNSCDRECRDMTDIFRKDYKSFATLGSRDGKSYKDVKAEYAPKGKPAPKGKRR